MKEGIMNINEHIFNHHDHCGNWCTHKQDNYRPFTRLPNRKPLEGDDLKEHLNAILMKQADNSNALAPNSSSNANESLNAMIAAKAPK